MEARKLGGEVILQREIVNGLRLVERATDGDSDGVEALLSNGAQPNADAYNRTLYYKSKNYRSPLHHAASNGHDSVVRLLIQHGADVDIVDMFGVTPMHLSAENGHVLCVRALLSAGAGCNIGTAEKRPQWVTATVYPYVAGTTPLHLAARNGHQPCIMELMLNGADYNTVDILGRTSMYVAAEMGNEDAVLMHLDNAYGKTILSLPVKDTGM